VTAEEERLEAARLGQAAWRHWGPYLSERQWGTVREDYSADGSAWEYITHENSRSQAYRWGEDGIAGISDDRQQLCFALTLWNGADRILKERLFGLSNSEGNHGEDVKEYYFYLDNVPSHAYMKYLYKYPQAAFPYLDLVDENKRRGRGEPEYELLDTGIFDEDRYFDVFIEYAKEGPRDMVVRITAVNRGPTAATLHLLPTLWFKDDWTWFPRNARPRIEVDYSNAASVVLKTTHRKMEPYWLYCETPTQILFTENESNRELLYGTPNSSPYVKDGINDFLIDRRSDAVNPQQTGSKASVHYVQEIPPGGSMVVLHAGQVGISLVCLLGFGLPLHSLRPDRRRIRQASAPAADARMVHAPQRPDSGLRMGIQRREPAGACLGGLARLSNRPQKNGGNGDLEFLERVFHKADAELHLVGESQGQSGPEYFPGRLPGLDNIGVFDRSAQLPTGGYINQSDGTSWMAMYYHHGGSRQHARLPRLR
jgi:hypothetical protein